MKRGLNVTLMMVAFAMFCAQAMALAPVISDIPDPVIGNETATGATEYATTATPYYFPDAFNLDTYVSDPENEVADADIQWSYSYTGSEVYRINDVDAIDSNTEDVNAPGAKRINGTTDDPDAVDALTATVTIRNVLYAPIGLPIVEPTQTGLIDSKVVTLFASDGTAWSQEKVTMYTDVGGSDRLGTGTGGPPPVVVPLAALPTSWNWEFVGGTITSSTNGNAAVCLTTALAGSQMASWLTRLNYVPLVQNAVYQIRLRVNGSQASAGSVPFWDFVLDNFDGTTGMNLYGVDAFFLDNMGGANAALRQGTAVTDNSAGTWFEVWWAPMAISTAAWNNTTTGVFASTVTDANRSMRFRFRILDVVDGDDSGITALQDQGTLCLNRIEVFRYDIANMVVGASAYSSAATLSASNFYAKSLQAGANGSTVGSAITYPSGACQIGNNASTQASAEYVTVYPGDTNINFGQVSTLTDNYTVDWQSNKLYMVTADMSTPTTGDAGGPYDVIFLGMDSVTNELISLNFVTSALNACGMPKATRETFRAFIWSHNESTATEQGFHLLRPRIALGNSADLNFAPNTGAVRIHSLKVNEVSFQ